jgi:hypothetical protein
MIPLSLVVEYGDAMRNSDDYIALGAYKQVGDKEMLGLKVDIYSSGTCVVTDRQHIISSKRATIVCHI